MLYKAVAASIMSGMLKSAQPQILEATKANVAQKYLKGAQAEVLKQVTEQYTRELEHNITQYILALEAAEVEVSYAGKPGEAFANKAKHAIDELSTWIEAQNPDGAVIKYIKRRYKEEGIGIITGTLYGAHVVQRRGQGVYEMLNTAGYAAAVDKRRPWLTGKTTQQGLEEMLVNAAKEIFDIVFDGTDLSDPQAVLNFKNSAASQVTDQEPSAAYTEAALSTMTRDQLKAIAGTKRNISKKELMAKILNRST